MIGIVVVSHSRALAEAAVALAAQMSGDGGPSLQVAAGTADGGLGTDAAAIAEAIDAVASPDGVLVLMDLGSAILSADLAREFVTADTRIVLSPAPFVEGLVAAVVTAAGGADLDTVDAEAQRALTAKRAQVQDDEVASTPASASPAPAADEVSFDAIVTNPSGLHARPAAAFARAAGRFDAKVRIADIDAGSASIAGDSLISLMALGVRQGTRIRVTASGPEARQATDELRTLIESGFGER